MEYTEKDRQRCIKHMFESACGYGQTEEAFTECMLAIPLDKFEDFVYTLYRIADKTGVDGFDGHPDYPKI
jgi:hypothetical protein